METQIPDRVDATPRVGEHPLTPGDWVFYIALFCLLLCVLFSVDSSMFEVTRVVEPPAFAEIAQ